MNILSGKCPIQRGGEPVAAQAPWLHELCPEWCESDHPMQHFVDDRFHYSSLGSLRLSQHDMLQCGDSWEMDRIGVAMIAPIGGQARIEVWQDHWKTELRLTPAEARELAAVLLLGAVAAEEGTR